MVPFLGNIEAALPGSSEQSSCSASEGARQALPAIGRSFALSKSPHPLQTCHRWAWSRRPRVDALYWAKCLS